MANWFQQNAQTTGTAVRPGERMSQPMYDDPFLRSPVNSPSIDTSIRRNPELSPSAPTTGQGMPSGDYSHLAQNPEEAAFIQRIVEAQMQGYGGVRPGQVEYYLNLRRDPAQSSVWATGEPGRSMDDYWVQRASGMGAGGADTATQGQYAGQNFGTLEQQQGGGLPPGFTTGYSGGQYPLSSVQGPGFMAPFNTPFEAPTGTDDPGFAFAMKEGQKALERSASAKGTLLTGGTLKELADYSTGMALRGYGDAWNRAKNVYDTSANIFDRNRQFQSGLLGNLASMGQQAASGYGNAAANIATGQGNAQAAGTAASGGIWGTTLGNLGKTAGDAYQWWREDQKAKADAAAAGLAY